MQLNEENENVIKGSIVGFICGDVLGYPFENLDNLSQYEIDIIKPSENEVLGTWSFASSSCLGVIDSIVELGELDFEDIKNKTAEIICGGILNPNSEAKDFTSDITDSVNNINNGMPYDKCGISSDFSTNESLFRVLPIALFSFNNNLEDFVDIMHKSSIITHRNLDNQVMNVLYGLTLRNILSNSTDKVSELLLDFYKTKKMVNYEKSLFACLEARNQILIGQKEIKNSFWTAWECYAEFSNYENSVVAAIEKGNDTNSTAAIVGSLSGLSYGLEDIPERWKRSLLLDSYTIDIIMKFTEMVLNE